MTLLALLSQIAQSAEPQPNQLLVDGIKLAEWRNPNQGMSQEADFPLKGTLTWDRIAEKFCLSGIANLKGIEPLTDAL